MHAADFRHVKGKAQYFDPRVHECTHKFVRLLDDTSNMGHREWIGKGKWAKWPMTGPVTSHSFVSVRDFVRDWAFHKSMLPAHNWFDISFAWHWPAVRKSDHVCTCTPTPAHRVTTGTCTRRANPNLHVHLFIKHLTCICSRSQALFDQVVKWLANNNYQVNGLWGGVFKSNSYNIYAYVFQLLLEVRRLVNHINLGKGSGLLLQWM